jgi:hypothetical protein
VSEVRVEDREGSLMSCEDCDQAQERELFFGGAYFYRWGRANIKIVACKAHAKEVMDALNKVQGENNLEFIEESGEIPEGWYYDQQTMGLEPKGRKKEDLR